MSVLLNRSTAAMAGALRTSCRLFASGQKCADCPSKGMASCPLPDIEDLYLTSALPRPMRPICRSLTTERRPKTTPAAPLTATTGGLSLSSDVVQTSAAARPSRQWNPVKARSFPQGCHLQRMQQQRGATRRAGMSTAALAMARSSTSAHVPIVLALTRRADEKLERDVISQEAEILEVWKERLVARSAAAVEPELSSEEGKKIFMDALRGGGVEGYFSLAQHGVTQADVKMSPLSALAVVLNALNHDPGQTWKGPWRWNTDEIILCSKSPASQTAALLERGMTVSEFTALARSKGVRAHCHEGASRWGAEHFREHLIEVCGDEEGKRHTVLGLGAGRFALVGGYSSDHDMVLVMDVVRHESPARWVSVVKLWECMVSGEGGGYVEVSSLGSADAWNDEEAQLCPAVLRSWSKNASKVMLLAAAGL